MSNIVLAAGGDDGYQISRSVRLRSSAIAYLSKTLTTPTNNKIWTWSGWVKRGLLGGSISYPNLFGTGSDEILFYSATYTDQFAVNMAGGAQCNVVTTQVFRDPSAWYHIIVAVDTTQATASNRVKIYVNGVQVTAFTLATYPSLNYAPSFNSVTAHAVGNNSGATRPFDGYLTEINFIDGQALTPSSFGETDAVTGVWKPKKYLGTYGTNGFYLNFSDNSAATAAAIGKDSSGNGNNWTPNNVSVTAGATYDSMVDVPTLGDASSNYCVLNPLTKGANITITNGNLDAVGSINTNTGNAVLGSIAVSSGKWYAEFKVANTYTYSYLGVADPANPGTYPGANTAGYSMEVGSGNTYNSAAGPTITGAVAGDTVMVAVDLDNGKIWWGKNGTWGGSGNPSAGTGQQFSGLTGTKAFMLSAYSSSGTFNANFGQRPFAYTPPTGFKALNTQNLPDATITKGANYFNAVTYTGNSGSQTVSNGLFQPDLTWHKTRSAAASHVLFDSIRGASSGLNSDATNAQNNNWTGQSFTSTGFTVSNSYSSESNYNGQSMVAWQWKKGAAQGFDIVTYTGTGANRTVAHSLGVAPSMMIVKTRSGVDSWVVYNSNFSAPSTDYLLLNSTAAKGTTAGFWNGGANSSTFGLGAFASINANAATYVAYLFAEVAGYSKFGSYTGNGSADGTFVYLGFRPRFILIKSSSAVQGWHIIDTARDTYNLAGQGLDPNTSAAEFTPASSGYPIDILSNGFKHRYASEPNVSGATYIYAAFAENPFKNSLAR